MAARLTRDAVLTPVVAMLAVTVLAVMCVARAAEPAVSATSQPIAFDIPAQPLPNALHAYGRQVGVQVLYDSHAAAGHQSVAIQGRFTPDEALKRLLANTDLKVRHARADAITLVSPEAVEVDLPPINPLTESDLSLGELRVRDTAKPDDLDRFAGYNETVRAQIQRALLRNPRSATGNYRAVLDLWIDATRTIRKASLLYPTGDVARDDAITHTLQGLTINQPTPADAPQPLRAVVAVSTAK